MAILDAIKTFAAATVDTTNVNQYTNNLTDPTNGTGLTDIFKNIFNVVIGIVGILAVVMIVLGGINYTTSAGDASKVKKAKDTILYGIIGLIISLLAFAIVNFVIGAL